METDGEYRLQVKVGVKIPSAEQVSVCDVMKKCQIKVGTDAAVKPQIKVG